MSFVKIFILTVWFGDNSLNELYFTIIIPKHME